MNFLFSTWIRHDISNTVVTLTNNLQCDLMLGLVADIQQVTAPQI